MPDSHPAILWQPQNSLTSSSSIHKFKGSLSFNDLYSWSINQPEKFWDDFIQFAKPIFKKKFHSVLKKNSWFGEAEWFVGGELNFAENLLRYSTNLEHAQKPAIISWNEQGKICELTFSELKQAALAFAAFLLADGISTNDVVVAVAPNIAETIVAMLGTATVGAIFASCSPDFGESAILDRFSQISPKALIAADGYLFKGERISCLGKINNLKGQLPSLKSYYMINYIGFGIAKGFRNFALNELLSAKEEQTFTSRLSNDPLYIMFSSGTTGKPKCIIHRTAGVLVEHLKEHLLHSDFKPNDKIFYQTTCGWMMWNWLVSALACGCCVVTYDGFPLAANGEILFKLCEKEKINVFGTNAKFLSTIEKLNLSPKQVADLSSLKSLLSTGSPLASRSFDFVYEKINPTVILSSISGGTDLVGCLALGAPNLPVYRGELQARSLGIAVEVFDEQGKPIRDRPGELVVTAPFPSMPLGFAKDIDQQRFKKTYFERYINTWWHGDLAEITSRGSVKIYGRSDATLNPSGVRIGTAEIYNQVESFAEIEECLVSAKKIENDEAIILLLKMKDGYQLSEQLKSEIREKIRKELSSFHLPRWIVAIKDLPRTKNGKLSEIAVKKIINGEKADNLAALANPESLEEIRLGCMNLK
ncbi:MAG TPA: acetoacetate--CoA ligase [Oligoflexia bacterium]|nr:acetoacetate--CoA ligase [Oligoflexia bacterium]HMP26696.1 acetoacetate--CoA ligase [Oligoflexia bacterium]